MGQATKKHVEVCSRIICFILNSLPIDKKFIPMKWTQTLFYAFAPVTSCSTWTTWLTIY